MTAAAAPSKITRTFPLKVDAAEERSSGELRLTGTAIVYDSPSEDLGGFVETLAPGAARDALARSDAFLLLGHDSSQILARESAGTLKLTDTPAGVRVEATMPPTTLARDTHLLAKTGHLRSMSFAFTVDPAGEKWTTAPDGSRQRRITKLGAIYEVSVVAEPAYAATTLDARAARRPAVTSARPVDPYANGSPHSWFRDLYITGQADERQRAEHSRDVAALGAIGAPPLARPGHSVEEARARLKASADREQRDITAIGTTAGGVFAPANAPEVVRTAFATAAKARGALGDVFPVYPLERTGLEVRIPRLTTAATVNVQGATENTGVSNTDPATGIANPAVATLAGYVDPSIQSLEQSVPGVDVVLAAELAEAYLTRLDLQLLYGSNSNGQTLGLKNVSGASTVTWTDASPTAPELLAVIGQTSAAVATALGYGADTLILHPRRRDWLLAKLGYSLPPNLPFRIVTSANVAVNGGAGTNEDEAFVVASQEAHLFTRPPTVSVYRDITAAKTAALTARVECVGFAAFAPNRKGGAAVGLLFGSGFVSPAW